jgi:hypothetical protein
VGFVVCPAVVAISTRWDRQALYFGLRFRWRIKALWKDMLFISFGDLLSTICAVQCSHKTITYTNIKLLCVSAG